MFIPVKRASLSLNNLYFPFYMNANDSSFMKRKRNEKHSHITYTAPIRSPLFLIILDLIKMNEQVVQSALDTILI